MHFVLPKSYFPGIASIIAAFGLNDSVRNGKMCDPKTKSGEQKARKEQLFLVQQLAYTRYELLYTFMYRNSYLAYASHINNHERLDDEHVS